MQPIQMQLSKKKNFFWFSWYIFEIYLKFWTFWEKKIPDMLRISKITDCERRG